MLERVVAARQLWCRALQRRWDLGTLMKYVCNVLIYHPPKNDVGTRCRCSPTLAQSLAAKMGLGDINEICLQGPNLSSSQKWAFHHDSVLLQPAMNAEEFLSLRKWQHKHSGTIAWPQLMPFWHQDGVRKLLELIAEHAQLFVNHFCDSKISCVTECFLVGASAFFNLSVSLKYF